MKTKYREFHLTLGNGETCRVRFCDQWGSPMFGKRIIHFEFRDCLSVSHTKFRSEVCIVGEHESFDPIEAAKEIIESLTGIKFSEENVQMKLI
jgi:hypothetical protein